MTEVTIRVKADTAEDELLIASDIEQTLRELHRRGGLLNPELDQLLDLTDVRLEFSTYQGDPR